MKTELIDLYEEAMLLAKGIEMERVANEMHPTLYPGRALEELSDEELVALTKAVITGVASWVS